MLFCKIQIENEKDEDGTLVGKEVPRDQVK